MTCPAPAGAPVDVTAALHRGRVEWYRQRFLHELQPVGAVETAVVADLARQAAAMERWGEAAEAVERHAARSLPAFALATGEDPDSRDAVLAGAMSNEAADRCERQNLGHTRAFYRALGKLEELQERRKAREQSGGAEPPPGFRDEADCEAYLAERFRRGEQPCPQCRATGGHYYASRRAWECGGCGAQVGLRSGTVMTRSPIPLRDWFEAIRWLLWRPTLSTAELAARTGIRRPTTLRAVARRIREAMAAEDASRRLAGLDVHFANRR